MALRLRDERRMRLTLLVFGALTLIACSSDGLGTSSDLGDHRGDDLRDPIDCSQWTDDDSCSAHACVPQECMGCGSTWFSGCYAPGVTPPECLEPPCVAPECGTATPQAECEVNPDCVALFTQAPCGCAGTNCCPMVYESCTLGPVECAPPTGGAGGCPLVPSCESGYLPAYGAQGCEIGCVEAAVCGM
jgi:hypothetical protein